MDVARALYLDLTGQPVIPGEAREGRKWVVENFDLISSPRYLRDSKLSVREWIRSYQGVEEGFWFARDDLAPFMMMGWSSLQWAFERLIAQFTKVREIFSNWRGKERRRTQPGTELAQGATRSEEAEASPTLVSRR